MPAAELAALVRGPHVEVVEEPAAALALARGFVAERPAGYVVVAGSIFLVGELRARLLGEAVDPVPTGDPLP
jgi:hypothetical protein